MTNRVIEKIEEVKVHISEHKKEYVWAGLGLAAGLTIGIVLKKRPTQFINQVAPVIKPTFNNSNQQVNFGGYAHKIVKCNETGKVWETVKDAAFDSGIGASRLSRHLNGHTDHLNGMTYSIIGVGTR